MERMEYPLGMHIGKVMRYIFKSIIQRFNELSGDKLTLEQFGILHTIKEKEEEVFLKDMAETMGKDKSGILRQIDSLEKKNLIRRVADKTDRRRNFLMITKNGERVVQEFFEIERKLTQELQAGISDEDLNTFYNVINKILENAMNK